jgi:hypothetical protein
MEAEMEDSALEVIERLVGEDDQSVEAWYLGGWCLWLMGSKEGQEKQDNKDNDDDDDDAEDRKALLMSSREWLRNCLKLYQLLEYEDERLRDHAVELVQGLDGQLGDEEIEEDEDDWIDQSGAESDADHEMGDT